MSYELAVFDYTEATSANDLRQMYLDACKGIHDDLVRGAGVGRFVADLTRLFPAPDPLEPEDDDESPWAETFDQSEGHVRLTILDERKERVIEIVHELAHRHGLAVYDPQVDQVVDGNVQATHRWWAGER